MDLGQSIKLNATINFQPPPSISYQWYEEAPGSSSFTPISGATSSSYTFTTTQSTTTGNWLFYVVVSWKGPPPGSPLTSNKAKVIVYNAPSISSQPSSATIDNGQSITLSSTVTGGTGTFSWQWYTGTPGSGSPIPSASGSGTTASYTASPSSTIEYYVVFTDTGTTSGVTPTETAQSTGATITVETASVSISPSSTQTIDNTQSITITSSISNGIGTPSYQWYESTTSGSSGFSKISGATSSSYTFTSSSTGNYWFNVTVIWTPSSPISGTSIATTTPVEIIVKALPTASINPSTAIIDSGQSVTLTALVSGGSGTFTYSWTIGGSSTVVSTSSSYSFSASTGTYKVWLNVTDTGTYSHYALSPTSASITVNPALSVPTPTVTLSAIDIGQSSSLSVTITTGTSPYTYQWYEEAPGSSSFTSISGATSSSYTFTTTQSTTTGNWLFEVKVTDNTGSSVTSSSVSITVYADPTVSVSPVGPLSYDVGQAAASLTASVTYSGHNTATVEWYSNTVDSTSGGVSVGSGTTFTPSTSSAGTTYYYAIVTDSGVPTYYSYSNVVEVTVTPSLSVSISPSSTSIDVGQPIIFTNSTSGGLPPYKWSYTVSPSSGWVQAGNKFTFDSVGTFILTITVTDSLGNTASSSAVVVVTQGLVGEITVTPQSFDYSQSARFILSIIGGSYPYTWTFEIGGSSANITVATLSPLGFQYGSSLAPGEYTFYFNVTDNSGQTSSQEVKITVYSSLSVSVNPITSIIDLGQSITLTGSATGGSGSYSYEWVVQTSSVPLDPSSGY
ncbi:MAG: hypothetical protein QW393_03840, partial [Candidatus Micrarchaeaceae archaeon]